MLLFRCQEKRKRAENPAHGEDYSAVWLRALSVLRIPVPRREGLPRKPWKECDKCLEEDFSDQKRVHIDPFGFIHVCQGITIGNIHEMSLKEILTNFDPKEHPICAPILSGGAVELVRKYRVKPMEGYVDECHLCYSTRLNIRNRFPKILAPDQVYGL